MGRTDKEIYRVIDNVNSYYRINSESKKELLLNKYPNAAAAYSLRLLDGYYRGPLVRVRRNDGVEVDVYPDYNNELSLDSLVTNVDVHTTNDGIADADATFLKSLQSLGEFVSNSNYVDDGTAVDATVCVWYDQSSTDGVANDNDAKQVTATNQPLIVSGGVIVTENGKAAVQFNGSSSTLKTSNLTATAQPTTHFIALKRANTTAGNWYAVDSRTTNQIIGTLSTSASIYGGAFLTGGPLTANQELQSALFNSTSSLFHRNGTQAASGNAGTSAWTGVMFGALNNEAQSFWNGSIQEYVVYTSDQSTNRTDIEEDINSFYQIDGYTPTPKLIDLTQALAVENGGTTADGTPAAAYSLRLLSSTYNGPLVRIRRTIDNTEVDVYPDSDGEFSIYSTIQDGGTELTTGVTGGSTDKTTLHEFLYGQDTDCMVVVWYDQSGNSNDATQTTTSRQPKVYDSAAGVVLENGKPILQSYAGVDFPTINYTGVTTQSVYAVGQIDTSSAALGQFNNSTLLAASSGGTGGIGLTATFYKNGTSYTPANQGAVYTDLYQTQSLIAANFNGSSYTSFSVSYPLLSAYNMFSLNEWLMFDNQDNRAAIETNINDYYDIF